MRIPSQIGYLVTGTATLALLAGCSGGGSLSPLAGGSTASTQSVGGAKVAATTHRVLNTSRSVLRPGVQEVKSNIVIKPFVNAAALAKAPKEVIVSDAADNVVNVYNQAGTQLAQLTGFSEPQGLTSDLHGNLYVADTSNSRVQVYAQGFKGTPTTLSDPGQYPAGVDSYGQGAYVAVTNIISTSGGPGSVSIFKGSTIVSTISNSSFGRVYFCAFDAKGNLFVDGTDPSGIPIVGEVANATSGGTSLSVLTTSNSISFPGGVQVDNSGNIVIDDQSGSALYTYAPPSGGSLGSPISTTPLSGVSDPVTFALTKPGTDLYTADAGLGVSQEFAYPAGGSPVSSITVGGQPIGVATIAAQTPH